MFSYKIAKLPKNTFEIVVDLSKEEINKEYRQTFSKLQKELEIPGFRKGKVPKEIAEKNIKKETVYQEVMKELIPKIYEKIIKKEGLKPIVSPKIEVAKAKEDDAWQIKITLAEKPVIELGDYRTLVKEIKSKMKKTDIWVPGKSSEEEQEKQEKKQREVLNQILFEFLRQVKFELSDLIIEEELNRRLTQLLDDVQKLGLTVETYLKSKKMTQEELKEQYTNEIVNTYKIEFILQEIADKEGIKVEQADLEKLFSNIKDEKQRQVAKQNSYFYAAILRKQKTLDFLLSL